MARKQNLRRTLCANIAWLVLVSNVTVFCQTGSLSQWLQTALENNPMIIAAKANVEAREKEIRIASSLPDPALSGGYFIIPVETRVGPQQARVGVSQMLPWPGKLLVKKDIAEKELNAVRQEFRSVEARVLSDVRTVYAEYYALGKEIDITHDNLKLLQEMEKVLLSRYSAAAVSQVSLIKVQVEMAVLEDQVRSLQSEEVKVQKRAVSLLNLTAETKLRFPDVLPELLVPTNADSLIDNALKVNPGIMQARFEVETASSQINLAKQTFAPDLMIMSDYIFTGSSASTMTDPSENGKNPWIVGGSVTIPVWIDNKKARVGKARAMQRMADAKVTNIENITESGSASLIEEYHDSKRKIALYSQTLIPQSQQIISLIGEAYSNDKATLLDFLDAQRMLLKLEVMLEKQRARMQIIAGKIDMLLGGTLTRTTLGKND